MSQDYYSSDDEYYETAMHAAAAFAIFSIEENYGSNIEIQIEDTRQLFSQEAKNTGEASMKETMQGLVHRGLEESDEVDAWEKAAIEKIRKRYEKMKSKILTREIKKKMKAKQRLEGKEGELEFRRESYLQHYKIKIARIAETAEEALELAAEKRRNQESRVKEKAKKIRSTGKVPVSCSCF